LLDPVEIVLRQREAVGTDQAFADERERALAQLLGRRLSGELREQPRAFDIRPAGRAGENRRETKSARSREISNSAL
jgi:hypothetical protein